MLAGRGPAAEKLERDWLRLIQRWSCTDSPTLHREFLVCTSSVHLLPPICIFISAQSTVWSSASTEECDRTDNSSLAICQGQGYPSRVWRSDITVMISLQSSPEKAQRAASRAGYRFFDQKFFLDGKTLQGRFMGCTFSIAESTSYLRHNCHSQ